MRGDTLIREEDMRKFGSILLGMIGGIALTVGLLWVGSGVSVLAKVSGDSESATSTPTPAVLTESSGDSPSDTSTPAPAVTAESATSTPTPAERIPDAVAAVHTPKPTIGPDELRGAGNQLQGPAFILPTPIPNETLVYFVPTDNDATATVLFLYNTDTVSHVIALRGFNYDGAMVYAQNITVPAASFRRLISDSVHSAPPPSWATPAPITTNFTDFVYFASLSLAKGVKVEGYTLFNPGTGVVDPRSDQGAIPLRFSTDPATVFLPSVSSP